jgi:peptide/nickel transport system substrate-binding protein
MELYKEYWEAVGLEIVPKGLDVATWTSTVHGLQHELTVYAANLGYWGVPPVRRWDAFPTYEVGTHWAPQWALWYGTNGEEGEEPPEDIKKLLDLYEEIKGEPSAQKRVEMQTEAMALHAKNIWQIGYLAEPDIARFGICRHHFRNLPDFPFQMDTLHPSTFFIKEG